MTPFMAMSILLIAAACFMQLAGAVPLIVSETRRDVVNPPVSAPNASTVWVIGETQTVVWDTSNLPEQITNPNGKVLLGFINDTTGNEHLMIDSPLASGFDITSGSVDIVVPDVEPRTDYIIALLGDSGNISDKFTIKSSTDISNSSAVPSSTSASAVNTSESSQATEPTATSPSASSSSEASTPDSTSHEGSSASSNTLESVSSPSSASGTTSASEVNATIGANISSAHARISLSWIVHTISAMLCIFILA